MGWQKYTTWTTVGRVEMDYESWIREGIVDEFVVFHNIESFVLKLLELKKDKPISISVLGPATEAEAKGGVRPTTDVWASICTGRTTPAPVKAEDLSSRDWTKRAQALMDAAAGALQLDAAAVAKAVEDPNVMVRRQAVRTLAALKAANQVAVIEKALLDREPSVHVAAAAALGPIHGPNSARALVEALRRQGTSPMKKAAIASFKAMRADVEPVLLEGLKDRSPAVRWVSAQALADSATERSRAALLGALRMDSDYRVRFYALQSLRARSETGLAACRLGLADGSTTVQLAAVAGLGALAPGLSKSDARLVLETLLKFFRQYGDGCQRRDAAWGWRVAGNAIAAFGEPGKKELESFRLQRNDEWLAWAAYQVLYVPQPNDEPVLTTEAEAVATHAKFAPPFPGWRMDKKIAFSSRGH
jgi:HEAT repeat protein